MSDVDDFSAEAAFGAVRESDRSRLRVLRVVVRIGDYKQDSFYGQGTGAASILPLDNDPIALRRQIWLLTDEAYKNAADAYAEKLSALKQFTPDPNPVDDFARAPVVSDLGDTVTLKVDQKEWDKTCRTSRISTGSTRGIQSVDASARFTAVNEYFVNSEGTIVRQGRTTATVTLSGSTQAADGMRLGRSPFWTEQRPDELPTREELLKESKKMLDSLQALEQGAHCGGILPRTSAVRAGRRGRHHGRADWRKCIGKKATAGHDRIGRRGRLRRATKPACCPSSLRRLMTQR